MPVCMPVCMPVWLCTYVHCTYVHMYICTFEKWLQRTTKEKHKSPKGRTELVIGGSGANKCAERHGNMRFAVAPQKPDKKMQTNIFLNRNSHICSKMFQNRFRMFRSARTRMEN